MDNWNCDSQTISFIFKLITIAKYSLELCVKANKLLLYCVKNLT